MSQMNGRLDEGPKRATNVSLSEAVASEARALGVNVIQAGEEEGLGSEVRHERAK